MLLNPHRIFDADWHGMSIHVIPKRHGGVELTMSFSAVFDPVRLDPNHIVRGETDSIPRCSSINTLYRSVRLVVPRRLRQSY